MPLLEHELARRYDGQLQLRPEPVRVRWTFAGLAAADGHEARCTFSCSARALPDPTERRMLAEVLLHDRPAVNAADLAAHFEPALRAAAARVAQSLPGVDLVADAGQAKLTDALRDAARPVAFACGVEILPPFQLEVESPTLQQQRLRSMHRALAEQQAAGQVEHFQRAAELLKQFQAIREAAPDLSAGHVLQQIGAADRGAALQTLLLASAKGRAAAQDLWAVAGPYLVKIDGNEPRLHPLPPTLGPLRSVQSADVDGERALLVGARSGFFLIRSEDFAAPVAYADPGVTSQLGFSRVVYGGPAFGFCGCHGDGGIVRWAVGQPEAPAEVHRTADRFRTAGATDSAGPRNLQVVSDGQLLFSVGSQLFRMDAAGVSGPMPSGSKADVVAIVPGAPESLIVHADGTICGLDATSGQVACRERRHVQVRAAGALPWLGSVRLLLATEEGPVHLVGLEDDLVTQYVSPHRGLRAVAGSAGRVAAVSPDRQRLVVWNSWDGKKPAAEIYLAGVARHRIADVQFA